MDAAASLLTMMAFVWILMSSYCFDIVVMLSSCCFNVLGIYLIIVAVFNCVIAGLILAVNISMRREKLLHGQPESEERNLEALLDTKNVIDILHESSPPSRRS